MNDQAVYDMLLEVDAYASGLSPRDIAFVADLIDRRVQTFTPPQERWIRRLHDNHVGLQDEEIW